MTIQILSVIPVLTSACRPVSFFLSFQTCALITPNCRINENLLTFALTEPTARTRTCGRVVCHTSLGRGSPGRLWLPTKPGKFSAFFVRVSLTPQSFSRHDLRRRSLGYQILWAKGNECSARTSITIPGRPPTDALSWLSVWYQA
jgi:hypothetical protein